MKRKPRYIQVLMPDNSLLDVHYYCVPAQNTTVQGMAKLIIQLDDCTCSLEIDEIVCNNQHSLEKLVHNRVINTKGHLC